MASGVSVSGEEVSVITKRPKDGNSDGLPTKARALMWRCLQRRVVNKAKWNAE